MSSAPNYLHPELPADLKVITMPIVVATPETLAGYGHLLRQPDELEIEIVRWPAQGWRPVDSDSGDEGGTTEGTFISEWIGDVLYGTNQAVGGKYILGYGVEPSCADESHQRAPERLLLWHANYHPDGGQLFFPQTAVPFLAPLAKPGDDVRPEDFVCFLFDGSQGLYIHPHVWHDGVYALRERAEFFGRQGAVHARVSVDFAREFGCLLEAAIPDLTSSPFPLR